MRDQVLEAHAGFPSRGGTRRVVAARAELAKLLWDRHGQRKLLSNARLDAALSALPPQELEWMFEFSPFGPLYFLPTRPFIAALVRKLRELEVKRVLEVAAGDGFLSRALAAADPALEVIATDSGAWEMPEARMSEKERRLLRGQHIAGLALGSQVLRLGAQAAVRRFAPDAVLCAWLPPGLMLDGLIRSKVRYVLEIGAGEGVTASAYSWRFAHEFLEGPIETRARCRLDTRPKKKLHSRVTLYFGRSHPEFGEERVRKGDWLFQFKP